MSRPLKQGLDYFPMDVEMDDKVELIEAKYGIIGFGILVKLYQKIYKEGYYLNCSEEILLIFSKRINVNINTVNEIINDCLRYQIFSESHYKKYSILTSSGIQKRYLTAIGRRKNIDLIKEYIIVDINEINADINWINTHISTQSKVKYSKVNESIYADVISYLNFKTKKKYKSETGKTKLFIDARLKEGFLIEDFKKVIDIKTNEWLGTDMDKFIRPETLFGNKFESYLNQNENNSRGYRDPKIIPAADYDKDRLHPGSDH